MGVARPDELVRLGREALGVADWERARAFFEQAAEFGETAEIVDGLGFERNSAQLRALRALQTARSTGCTWIAPAQGAGRRRFKSCRPGSKARRWRVEPSLRCGAHAPVAPAKWLASPAQDVFPDESAALTVFSTMPLQLRSALVRTPSARRRTGPGIRSGYFIRSGGRGRSFERCLHFWRSGERSRASSSA
jgi:hypothetical protein